MNVQPPQLTRRERRELRRQEQRKAEQQNKLNQRSRRFVLWLLIVLAVGGGILGMIKLAARAPQDAGPTITVDAINSGDWVKGSPSAKALLVEYSDLQCPACAYYYPLLKKLNEEFGDKLAIAYRHFPLPMHQNAKGAAYAAEAAGRQGKFWEMHDMIFGQQSAWKDERSSSVDSL